MFQVGDQGCHYEMKEMIGLALGYREFDGDVFEEVFAFKNLIKIARKIIHNLINFSVDDLNSLNNYKKK